MQLLMEQEVPESPTTEDQDNPLHTRCSARAHTSALMGVHVKGQHLAFLAPAEYILKTPRMKAEWDVPHKCFQLETTEVFILMGCCQLITFEKNKRK